MLGSQFLKTLSGIDGVEAFAFDKEDLDIADKTSLEAIFHRISPDFVLNCAAFTDVDGCEDQKDVAFKINGEALAVIAAVCKQENAALVHFSTDYVFDGSNADGYKENDPVSPINVYGESKLRGEELIAQNMDDYYIIRTSWLFGENGKNFVDTMVKLGKERDYADVVDDQIGSPTYTKDLCEMVIEHFLNPFLSEKEKLPFGIYHLTNSGTTSWYGFAKKIFELADLKVKVKPISSEAFLRPAKRPKCSILINTKIPYKLRPWEEALKVYLELQFL
jgi:dTDP-4-dehydrorhamnose reductase